LNLGGGKAVIIGDSKADIPIFNASRNGYKMTRKGLIHV
jgi:phosphoserine phosphatase